MRMGLALSGGGVRCVAHLAVVKALREEGIVPHSFSGTSAGALAACLLSYGFTPERILRMMAETSVFQAIRPALTLSGLLDVEKALSFCLKHLPQTFEELDRPVHISVTNVRTGRPECYSSGPLLPPLLASCCVPVLFKPVRMWNDFYIDGGLTNNLPVEPLRESCERVVGVHTNPVGENFQLLNMRGLLERTFLLAINGNVQQRKALCEVFLEPPCLVDVKVFQFKKGAAVFKETLSWMEGQLPAILAKLS